MRSTILKHCAGRGYNTPLMQEKKGALSGNLEYNADNNTVTPSLDVKYKNVSLSGNATNNLDTKKTTFNSKLTYEGNKGFNANIGVEGSNVNKPIVSAGFGFKF